MDHGSTECTFNAMAVVFRVFVSPLTVSEVTNYLRTHQLSRLIPVEPKAGEIKELEIRNGLCTSFVFMLLYIGTSPVILWFNLQLIATKVLSTVSGTLYNMLKV